MSINRWMDSYIQWNIQFSSVAQSCPTLCNPMNHRREASLSITNSRSSLRLTSIELVMPSSHLIPCRPLPLLPPILPSIRVFSNESTLCMRWPKYWSFSFSIIPSKEIPGLISFWMDWLRFPKYSVMSSANNDSFISSFPIWIPFIFFLSDCCG